MPLPQFRNVGPTVLRQGRLGDAVQAPIWLEPAPCHDDQRFVTGLGIPRYRNVGPTPLRAGRIRDGVQSPIWLDQAPPRDDQTHVVPNVPALCDVGAMVLRNGRKRGSTQSPIWFDPAAPRDDIGHKLTRSVPNPSVGPIVLRQQWTPLRGLASRLVITSPVSIPGSGADVTVSDSSPITTVAPTSMNTYLLGVPHVKLTVEFQDDDGNLVDPSTIQLRVYQTNVIQTTLLYQGGTYLGQAITRTSIGRYAFKLMSPIVAAWDYAWDTTGPIRIAEASFRVVARKH